MGKRPIYTKNAQSAYNKRVLRVTLTANPNTEPDIHEYLSKQPNMNGAVKALIRAAIASDSDIGASARADDEEAAGEVD